MLEHIEDVDLVGKKPIVEGESAESGKHQRAAGGAETMEVAQEEEKTCEDWVNVVLREEVVENDIVVHFSGVESVVREHLQVRQQNSAKCQV